MAYAFNNVMGMMDKDRQTQGSSNPQSSVSQGLQKNAGTGEGEMSVGGAGASNTAQSPADFTKSKATSAKTILDRNKGVQQTGIENRLTQDAQNQANTSIDKIRTSSNEYAQNQDKKANEIYGLPDQTAVNRAVYGNEADYQNISNTLNRAPGQVDQYEAPDSGPLQATEYNRANDLSNLFLKQGGEQYNRGMAALDNLQFQRTGGAQNIANRVGQLQSNVDAMKQSVTDKEFGTQALAQKQLETKAKETQDAIRKMLGSSESDIRNQVNARVTGLDQSVHKQAKEAFDSGVAGLQSRIDNATRDITNRMLTASPEEQGVLQNVLQQFSKLNPKAYVEQILPRVGFDTAMNADEAQRLNRVNELLGVQDRYTVPTNSPVGTANVRTDNFDPRFAQIMAMLPQVQAQQSQGDVVVPQSQAPAAQAEQRVLNTVAPQIQSTKNKGKNYNPFASIGI